MYINNKLILETDQISAGSVHWRSPSNIALVKYWGKYGLQLPQNASVSFTLSQAFTETLMEYEVKETPSKGIDLELYFHTERNEAFEKKTIAFFTSLIPIFPFLEQIKIKIRTGNSFPHSAGIASSASGMSALALCLCSLEHRFFSTLEEDEAFDAKASYIARLGSGSACRSIYAHLGLWGSHPSIEGSNNETAIPVGHLVHESFHTFHDDILIVSSKEKGVSSRAGHGLMESNPYAPARYHQANRNVDEIMSAMKTGDMDRFGQIVEQEALTLHALMMASQPPFILMEPATLQMIQAIQQFRKETNHPVYFTLDAGPNIHLLYPTSIVHDVMPFTQEVLLPLCENGFLIHDHVGEGPEQV